MAENDRLLTQGDKDRVWVNGKGKQFDYILGLLKAQDAKTLRAIGARLDALFPCTSSARDIAALDKVIAALSEGRMP